jgi:hypothetical protein
MAEAIVDLSEFRKTGDYPHYIGVATPGFLSLGVPVQAAIVNAFKDTQKGDHFYTINCGDVKVFIAENGERGYTAMLPSEY